MDWYNQLPPSILNTVTLLLAVSIAWLAHQLLLRLLKFSAHIMPQAFANQLILHIKYSSFCLLLLIAFNVAIPILVMPETWYPKLEKILLPFTIIIFGWLLIGICSSVGEWLMKRFDWSSKKDNLRARQINMQIRVIIRVIIAIIILLIVIGVAMSIPSLKNLGVSLFASAGVAGLAIGIAARPLLTNLIAGIQLGLTQPIRIDDAVIVQGEWGNIEEIRNTYVVVRIWDLRRLIVPLSYFIDNPFQNWTYKDANLIGTVFLYVDYTMPVEPLREELKRLIATTELWDKKTCVLQVTDIKEQTMEIRILMSSDNSLLYDLRCFVRENMMNFIQQNYAEYLPKIRPEIIKKV